MSATPSGAFDASQTKLITVPAGYSLGLAATVLYLGFGGSVAVLRAVEKG